MELRNCSDGIIDDGGFSYLFTRCLINPFVESLACNERILRHGANRLAACTEILGKPFIVRRAAVFLLDDEIDVVHVLERGHEGQVGIDCFAAVVLGLANVPTRKLFALDHGVGRKFKCVA